MDKTPLIHVAVAVCLQLLFWLVLGEIYFGTGFAIGWFWSREHAQREAAIFPRGQYVPSEWWKGFLGWSKDRWFDAVLPTIVVLGIMAFLN